MYFDMKSYLKSNRNYTAKHTYTKGFGMKLLSIGIYTTVYII